MIIAQISDSHILAKSNDLPEGTSRAGNLRRCIADINRQNVDLVIHTGDSVQDGKAEEYAHLRDILSDLDAPLFLIPGNRDRHQVLRATFGHFPYLPPNGDFLQYVIDDYPLRLIALDSIEPGERKGVFCADRLSWLERTLAEEPDKPTILFMHHPPFDIAPYYVGGYRHQDQADKLASLVSRNPQIKRLLCGHVHCLYEADWSGTQVNTMPSIAVDLRMETDVPVDPAPLYLLHTAASDGGLTSRPRVVSS